ncbi:MAG: 16S rRNA (adenine(1518)-N(6)/adenine(1519)-N(6)) -dimethyltransferase RsmA [Planctomycetaceae bacterium]
MKDAVRQTRSHLMKLFEQHGFHPRTMLGQNFLVDLNIVEFIAERANLGPNDVVLEVGAGTAGLTTFLAQYAAEVVSVEIDENMFQLAKSVTADFENVTLLNQDALKNKNRFSPEVISAISERLAVSPKRKLKLVANLPYNIATPVVSNLVATDLPWDRMVVTIQWELGLRMSAKPRTSHYGALSVWLQSQCFVKILKRLPPTVFWPRPAVESAIVQLVPNPAGRDEIADRPFFQDFLRRLFHQRRKLARSVLVGMYRKQMSKSDMDEILQSMNFPETIRAEEMTVKQLVELSNRIYRRIENRDN